MDVRPEVHWQALALNELLDPELLLLLLLIDRLIGLGVILITTTIIKQLFLSFGLTSTRARDLQANGM